MQTLNVGAGQSDAEYAAAAEERRAELRADSYLCANLFFVAAALAAVGSGALPIRLNILVNVGVIDLLRMYVVSGRGGSLAVLYLSAVIWPLTLVGLGFAARAGNRWAFWAGIVIYATDAIALIVTFSLWAFGVHAFFIYKWFEGQKQLGELKSPSQ